MPGPLQGIRIIEFAGIGPGPFCGMMLADQGAEVVRLDRLGQRADAHDILGRSRKSILIDTKKPEGAALARDLCRTADGIIEGFRPGVMERLGLGPEVLLQDNPKLIYGRMTGWGQYGPLAQAAGHDINYISISGVLHTVGVSGGKPVPPVNYIGDFGGGGMMLAFGIVSALLNVRMGGNGQVIDAAMTDGSALLSGLIWQLFGQGMWRDEPGVNLLDGGAHFYDTYECADGKYVSIGSLEPQFYKLLREKLAVADDPAFATQSPDAWPSLKSRLAAIFRTRPRSDWCALMEGTDICFAPVLSMAEALTHPHNVARGTFVNVDGVEQPAPAPRFSGSPADTPEAPRVPGQDTNALLQSLGVSEERIAVLRDLQVIG
jgi:alpha-methylacyl-CoA racemase